MKFKYLYIIILLFSLISITTAASPVANFTSNVSTGAIYPLVILFTDDSTNIPTIWNWSFGDGRWFNTTNSALKNVTYQYVVAGKYNVSLLVNNTDGNNISTKIDYINLTSDTDSNLTAWTHMNGTNGSTTFTSEQGIAWATQGGAQISTLMPKYGGASGWFPSALNSYISTPNSSALQFGTGDFTIEFWINVTTVTGINDHIFSKTNNPRNQGWGLDRTNSTAGDSGWDFYMGNDSAGQVFFDAPIPNKTWTHIAVERISGTIYLYINGNLTASKAGYNANYDTSDPLWIGRQQNSYFNGYVDEFRISKTARWKSNFTPPYDEYRGYQEAYYPDINPNSTFRYKTDPTGVAYIDNSTPRNRTIQIQNISNATYTVGQILFDPLYGYVTGVRLNLTLYLNPNMTLLSYTIDNTSGTIDFNISKPTGFSPGTDRASIIDYKISYVNYTDGNDPMIEYFGYGYMINGTTGNVYGIHNFLSTPISYGDWNFTANFTATNTTFLAGNFTTFVSTFNGSYPNRWNWSFGDGTFDNGTNSTVTHLYLTGGLKTVTLTEYLWQNNSVNNTIIKTNYINVTNIPPNASFTSISTGSPWLGMQVQFNDTSLNYPDSWNWSFGDGNVSALQNPLHVYNVCGNFSVLLRVENIGGIDWENKSDYIYVSCNVPPTPPTPPDERIAMRMNDIGAFVVIAAIILVIALVTTFIYMWAKKRS